MPKIVQRCWKRKCEREAVQQMEGNWCCPDHPISSASNEKIVNAKKIRHVKSLPVVKVEDLNEVNTDFPICMENEKCITDVNDGEKEPIVFVGKKRSGQNLQERGDSAKYTRSDAGEFPTKVYYNNVFRKVVNAKKLKSKIINRKKTVQGYISSEGEEEEQNVFSEYIQNSVTERKEKQVGEDAPGTSTKLIPSEVSYTNEGVSGPSRVKDEVKKENVRIVTKSGKEAGEPKVQKVKMSEEDLSKKISKLSESHEKALIDAIMKKCNVSENLAKSHVRSLNPKK